ncbi:hypothetical protein [Streptosporangium saharense]|uniref:hypothetical protein n=1 Tax=Streptosporangium saharense TaxID=1706840 RepID=UPI00342C5B55
MAQVASPCLMPRAESAPVGGSGHGQSLRRNRAGGPLAALLGAVVMAFGLCTPSPPRTGPKVRHRNRLSSKERPTTNYVTSFAEIKDQFDTYIGDIVYATMITVDQKGRPRA